MTTNAERIAAMDEFKRRHGAHVADGSCCYPGAREKTMLAMAQRKKHKRDMDGIAVAVATMLVVLAAIAIAFAIAVGLFSHASEGPYRSVSDIIADCEASGKVAHVDHDSKRVLTVHCDVR